MKKNRSNFFVGLTMPLLLVFNLPVIGQPNAEDIENKKLTVTILHLDSLFWKTYNECEPKKAGQFLSNDVKFFHDKGGITEGKENLIASVQKNICGNLNQKIRREAVDGTVKVYPLRNAGTIYGAIISGEHYFYVKAGEQTEKREGLAKFTQLWLLNNNKWEMSHILSYDHGPAPHINKNQEIKLSENDLKKLEGNYKNPKFGSFNFKTDGTNLVMDGPGLHSVLYTESNKMLFTKERDLKFEFVEDNQNNFFKIIVHENGVAVDELLRF